MPASVDIVHVCVQPKKHHRESKEEGGYYVVMRRLWLTGAFQREHRDKVATGAPTNLRGIVAIEFRTWPSVRHHASAPSMRDIDW
jgi:hypothetical protein